MQTQLHAEPATLDWGTLNPGQTEMRMLTLSNLSAESTQPLNMTNNCDVGLLQWNSEGATLESEESHECVFTLTIWDNATVGPFDFTILIIS